LGPAQLAREPEPPLAPSLVLEVREQGPTVPWQLTLRNTGSASYTVHADARLIGFAVQVPGVKKAVRCALPEVLRPRPNQTPRVVLAPGDAVVHEFDPRLYCFADAGQSWLVPGAQITPRFGWRPKVRTQWRQGKRVETVVDAPPYVAELEGSVAASERAPRASELVGASFALRSEYAAWNGSATGAEPAAGPLRLTLKYGSDARSERDASVSLDLTNISQETLQVFFRRELVSFEVVGPLGHVTCDAQPDERAPERSAFSALAPGRSLSAASRLVELCPDDTFRTPGLYLVHGRFESLESGGEFGLEAFVGEVVAPEAVALRVREGGGPLEVAAMRIIRAGGAPEGEPVTEAASAPKPKTAPPQPAGSAPPAHPQP
jgi:hypothetical protein